jgi:hypothetical protein
MIGASLSVDRGAMLTDESMCKSCEKLYSARRVPMSEGSRPVHHENRLLNPVCEPVALVGVTSAISIQF